MSQTGGAGHREHQEIIIVRRKKGHDDGHHGGVWKIAFADFMTAMMAFFLVMWLTNSSDDSTRKQVAQYFNPIKMTDSAPSSRGIEKKDDQGKRKDETQGQVDATVNGDPSGKPIAGEETGGEEQALFRDPYAVLAEIAAESVASGAGDKEGEPDGSGLPGLNGGDAYRDPFDPASWQLSPNMREAGGDLEDLPPSEFKTAVLPPEGAEDKSEAESETATDTADASQEAPAAAESKVTTAGEETERVAELKKEIEEKLASMGEGVPAKVEVSEGDGGVKISLADDFASGMFSVGSARPNGEAVAMMEKIADVLKERQGQVVIRGHTDARPFSGNGEYDNWRLSTARAHMAYYMLVRGGLQEARVQAIEGFADREPKDAADPEAAINRRIEILLVEPA
ncbi:MAG: MotB family protein [Fulvimarina manganoxydans]|uniref:MotB family protein n=1 Tax=Fulvimarina manganoxydans TaxID=937218 RepID=UPI0023557032|nr:MotB family protein [Fulvimarina manganoxydans]MCK5932807.1 MotB family protein [Fulvimarina manganoxydans]